MSEQYYSAKDALEEHDKFKVVAKRRATSIFNAYIHSSMKINDLLALAYTQGIIDATEAQNDN